MDESFEWYYYNLQERDLKQGKHLENKTTAYNTTQVINTLHE